MWQGLKCHFIMWITLKSFHSYVPALFHSCTMMFKTYIQIIIVIAMEYGLVNSFSQLFQMLVNNFKFYLIWLGFSKCYNYQEYGFVKNSPQ